MVMVIERLLLGEHHRLRKQTVAIMGTRCRASRAAARARPSSDAAAGARVSRAHPGREEPGDAAIAQVEAAPQEDGQVDWEEHVTEQRIAHAHVRGDRAAEARAAWARAIALSRVTDS
jgi:hypothetical protein